MALSTKICAMCLIGMMLVATAESAAAAGHAKPVSSARASVQTHRKLLWLGGRSDRAGNSERAQAATQQAILAAVDSGASLRQTQVAAEVGLATAWAVGRRGNVFETVERATAPSAIEVK